MTNKKEETTLPALIKTAKLTSEDAKRITEQYKEVQAAAKDWVKKAKLFVITEPTQVADIASCKAGYDYLRNKFNEIEALRKELKEESLRKGQTIDAIAKRFKALIEPTMNDLKAKSEFTKTYNETYIKEKGEKRLAILAQYDVYMGVEDAAAMLDDVFENYVEIARKNFETRNVSEPATLDVPAQEPMIGVRVDHTESKKVLFDPNHPVAYTSNPIAEQIKNAADEVGVHLSRNPLVWMVDHLQYTIDTMPTVIEKEAIEVMKEVEQDLIDAINRIKKYLDGTK